MKKILIVEDEPLVAQDIKSCLQRDGFLVVGIASRQDRAMDLLHSQAPDAVILDINLNGRMVGIDIAKKVNELYKIPFIFLTSYADKDTLDQAKLTLPFGYILKPFDANDLRTALEIAIFKHESNVESSKELTAEEFNSLHSVQVSDREFEILEGIFDGLSNGEMAAKYFVSENTIKSHIKRIYVKLDVNSRSEVVKKMIR